VRPAANFDRHAGTSKAEQAIAARYRVQSIPSLILFRKGREVAGTAGEMPLHALLAWVRSVGV
jgi:thioredoxin 2